jgi:protein-S-isoprenylcysteine O-methyltransferase Ste14
MRVPLTTARGNALTEACPEKYCLCSRITLVAIRLAKRLGPRLSSYLIMIVLPLLLAYINLLVIPVEEKNLRGVFGDEYQKYSERVGRWL